MDIARNWMARALLFSPFLLPLLMRLRSPFYFHEALWSVPLAFLYLYCVTPMLDHIGGRHRANMAVVQQPWIFRGAEYDMLPRLLAIQILFLKAFTVYAIVSMPLEGVALIGTAVITGQFLGAYGIIIAHELLHRRSRYDKALAEALMLTVLYPHWCIEHPMGHHRHVGTWKDPATARYGESLYRFMLRCAPGELIWACRNERERLQTRGFGWWSPQNRIFRYLAEIVALIAALYLIAGGPGVIALFVHAATAIFALQIIHYVQHYGIERKEIAPGVYEPMTIRHSWDSPFRYSNLVFLNLGRHGDHHDVPSRSFQALRLFSKGQAPELPWGLATAFVVALIPPLWFRVMNPRVLELRKWSETPLPSKYSKMSLTNTTDPDLLLAGLKKSHERGELKITVLEVEPKTKRELILSRWESLSAFLLVPVIVLAFGADMVWRRPWGLIYLTAAFVVVLAARFVLARTGSNSAALRPALASVYAWELLWRGGKVELRAGPGDANACLSPDGDWLRFARLRLERARPTDTDTEEDAHGKLAHNA